MEQFFFNLLVSWVNWKDWIAQRKKKHLMFDDYLLDKMLDKFKNVIDIEKFDDSKIWLRQMINWLMALLLEMFWY